MVWRGGESSWCCLSLRTMHEVISLLRTACKWQRKTHSHVKEEWLHERGNGKGNPTLRVIVAVRERERVFGWKILLLCRVAQIPILSFFFFLSLFVFTLFLYFVTFLAFFIFLFLFLFLYL